MSPVNVKLNTMPASTVTALRLHNQKIAQSSSETPAQVLGWLGGIQGQDYNGAKWSLGLRLPGSTDSDMEKATTSSMPRCKPPEFPPMANAAITCCGVPPRTG